MSNPLDTGPVPEKILRCSHIWRNNLRLCILQTDEPRFICPAMPQKTHPGTTQRPNSTHKFGRGAPFRDLLVGIDAIGFSCLADLFFYRS
jgi:hypothetical protein